MSKKTILITGGAGNVGSSLAARLASNPNNKIIIVDNLLTGSLDKLPSKDLTNWSFVKADVNDYNDIAAVMLAQPIDYVFHYAAVVGVKRTQDNPKMVLNDITGFKNVFDLCKNIGVKRVFFSSSSEVYGEPVEHPQHEVTTPLNAREPYAIVKNVGESFLKSYYQEHGLSYTIFRFFNTYGPQQSTDFVIAKFIALARANKDITIYGDGSQTRTFCYVDDNLDTIEKILEDNLCVNDVINIGNDIEMTIVELAQKIISIINSKSKLKYLPALKAGDMSRRKPDVTKMKSVLNRPLTNLKDGVLKSIELGTF